jgi:hypothetical protein
MAALRQSLGRARAIALYGSQWWLDRSAREIAKFQLCTIELCLPFEIFHRALEAALDRPVWMHELGYDVDGLIQEFLDERDPPTLEEILALIPPEKRSEVFLET